MAAGKKSGVGGAVGEGDSLTGHGRRGREGRRACAAVQPVGGVDDGRAVRRPRTSRLGYKGNRFRAERPESSALAAAVCTLHPGAGVYTCSAPCGCPTTLQGIQLIVYWHVAGLVSNRWYRDGKTDRPIRTSHGDTTPISYSSVYVQ
jgi:hypothetical protein